VSKRALLLAQLGTPDAPTPEAVRRYLAEFLSDVRVVDYPRWLWLPLLHGIILRVRPKKSAALYRRVWMEEGSPLLVYSQRLQRALADALGSQWQVALGMRYGNPSLQEALEELKGAGFSELVVLPLFPQYSRSTSESVYDKLELLWPKSTRKVKVVELRSFATQESYLEALALTAREAQERWGVPRHWLLSFHGLPRRYVKQGDPYATQCEATARALAAKMGWPEDRWELGYQSRFGPEPWITPNTQERLLKLGKAKTESLYVMTPSFTSDCLETLDEIGELGREMFQEAGGGDFRLLPCLNDHPAFVRSLTGIIRASVVD
jgi:ferrochelatase